MLTGKGGMVMPDREKVVSELQSALEWCQPDDDPNGSIAVKIWAVRDAISLLNEQDALLKEQDEEIREKNQRIWELLCERDSDDGR